MKNSLVRSFLSLCILLLSGFGLSYGHAYGTSTEKSSQGISEETEHAGFDEGHSFHFINSSAASKHVEIKIQALEIIEEEEKHQWSSSKKNREISNFFTAIFSGLSRG